MMNSVLTILACLVVVGYANPVDDDVIVEFFANGDARCRVNCHRNRQHNPNNPISPWNDCPPTNCPPPTRPANCGAPDCTIIANRVPGVVFDHPLDPNRFIVCAPLDAVTWAPKEKWCGCGTVFSSVSNTTKCVHPWEWVPACPSQQNPPVLSTENCGDGCINCNGPITPPTLPPTVGPPEPTVAPPTVGPPVTDCPCPCIPCVWWPCQPCPSTCPCNGQNRQNPVMEQPRFPMQFHDQMDLPMQQMNDVVDEEIHEDVESS